jgi:hypothetical protein
MRKPANKKKIVVSYNTREITDKYFSIEEENGVIQTYNKNYYELVILDDDCMFMESSIM